MQEEYHQCAQRPFLAVGTLPRQSLAPKHLDERARLEGGENLPRHPSTSRRAGFVLLRRLVTLLVSDQGIQSYRTIYDTAHYEGFVAGSDTVWCTTNVRSLIKRIRRKVKSIWPLAELWWRAPPTADCQISPGIG